MSKVALITGITGQDGSYLAEHLLSLGYEVHGIIRRSSSFNTGRIDHIFNKVHLHYGDLLDSTSMMNIIKTTAPDEIYNLASQSHVRVSFDVPQFTCDVTGIGVSNMLEILRTMDYAGKVYQASSSEMFGSSPPLQNEDTRFRPCSPYACAKVFAHHICQHYRETYGMYICCGILFNHESPRRGETFVTKKITRAVARIKLGLQDKLYLGNLDAKRDWGYTPEYVEAMHLMLQHDKPDDYVVATGETHSVEEFVVEVFKMAGLNWKDYVEFDPRYLRPKEVNVLCGDASKIKDALGWEPQVKFSELCSIMYNHDYDEEGKS